MTGVVLILMRVSYTRKLCRYLKLVPNISKETQITENLQKHHLCLISTCFWNFMSESEPTKTRRWFSRGYPLSSSSQAPGAPPCPHHILYVLTLNSWIMNCILFFVLKKIALAWMVQKEQSRHCAGGILADDQVHKYFLFCWIFYFAPYICVSEEKKWKTNAWNNLAFFFCGSWGLGGK